MKRHTLDLGPALRMLRKRLGLSQIQAVEQIERRTGLVLVVSTLSRWERSLAVPSLKELSALLSGLGCTLWDLCNLLDGIDEETLLDKLRRSTDPARAEGEAPVARRPDEVGPLASQALRSLAERIAAIELALQQLTRRGADDESEEP